MRLCLRLAALFAMSLAQPALADDFQCNGTAPDWSLTVTGAEAELVDGRSVSMERMQSSTAEGHVWPRAYTLIGDRDTAILIVDGAFCTAKARRAHVLTQRGNSPILLTGCCEETQ